jgi:hypothetical protein
MIHKVVYKVGEVVEVGVLPDFSFLVTLLEFDNDFFKAKTKDNMVNWYRYDQIKNKISKGFVFR